ncbi:Gldg family protein [Chitinophaga tropicalis]|uniref:ABC transporter permease subunit n=1 Tax=Chitinophaga tropicalis TaxID=2683588 RepID=A0A7K1U3E2_9BACT|nr:Gldg family protein [Chitinophaga tropicalis]MVT08806.1 ABC transporter permease subunit [Chitinophaga tropicalis]
MKVILKIARTELRTLFYSPIAWFLMIVFLIQCGSVYLGQLQMLARQQEISGTGSGFFMSYTNWVYLSQPGLFGKIMQNLYLYVPLLTMSLISREISSGTIKLLYSSPIKVYEIVFGKYLAMMVYSLVLVGIVGVFLLSGMFHIEHPETGMLTSAMFGFYLLLCAYSAIGLFMSCLTGYQVVAAISTFVMIGILSYIGSLWQRVDFVRELTYYFSINGRTQSMLGGLITTKDVIYFIVIVYIFLGLSIYKLKAGMESKPAIVKASRYAAVMASALLIGYVSSIPGLIGYYDTTLNKSNTLTPRVQKILAGLGDEPLEVTAYVNLLDRYFYLGNPGSYNINKARWEDYTRFKDNIILKKVTYYDSTEEISGRNRYPGKNLRDVAEQYAKGMDVELKGILSPQQMRKIIDLRPENNRYVMQLKWKDHTTFLRVFDDMIVWPTETEVAAALQRLQQVSLPKIAFLTGNLERGVNKTGDRDYKTLTNLPSFRYSLINQGFDVVSVELEYQDIPKNIAAVVLADPRVLMSDTVMNKLRQYISNGGNLLIAGEPGKQAILNPLLKELGIQIMNGTVIQESKDNAPNFVETYVEKSAGSFYTPLEKAIADSQQLTLSGVAGITWASDGAFAVQPLAKTAAKTSWNRIKPLDVDNVVNATASGADMDKVMEEMMETGASAEDILRRRKRDTMGTVTFSAADGDVIGPITTIAALTRTVNGKQQRIVVSGDADFFSNKELRRNHTINFVFSTSLFRWMSGGEFPIDASRPDPQDKRVKVTLAQLGFLRIIYLWVMPVILLAFGAILLIRRKRK